MLYYNYQQQRKRKGKPLPTKSRDPDVTIGREIGERKATGLRSRVYIFYESCFRGESERKVSRAAEAVTNKMKIKSYGFFIQSKLRTLKKFLESPLMYCVEGQSIVEYTLIFIAFALGVVFFISRSRISFTEHFNSAVAHILR